MPSKKKKKGGKKKKKVSKKQTQLKKSSNDGRVRSVLEKLKDLTMDEAKRDPTRISRRAFELLQTLKSLQTSLPCSMRTSTKEQNETLMEWYEKNKRKDLKCNVEIRESPGEGNGVFAVEDVEKHDLIFEVPYDMIMLETSAKERLELLIQLCPSLDKMSPVLMSLYVLAERLKGKESKFHSYISTLPTMFTIPVCFESVKEFEYLRGLPALLGAVSVFRNTVLQYCNLYDIIAHATLNFAEWTPIKVEDFTWENWRWAVAIVMTRQNKVPVRVKAKEEEKETGEEEEKSEPVKAEEEEEKEVPVKVKTKEEEEAGEEEEKGQNKVKVEEVQVEEEEEKKVVQVLALVPMFDAINHESGGEITTDGDPDASVLKCYAMRDFKKTEQVKMFYGNRTDAEFVLYSGFLPDRPNGVKMYVDVDLDPRDPLVKLKQMLLQKVVTASSTGRGLAVEIQFDEKMNPKFGLQKLLGITRVIVATKKEIESLIRSKNQIFGARILSSENEIRTYEGLKRIFSNRLNMYPKFDNKMKDLKIDDGLLSTDIKKLRKRVAAMAVKRDRSMLHSLMSHVNKQMNKAFADGVKRTEKLIEKQRREHEEEEDIDGFDSASST